MSDPSNAFVSQFTLPGETEGPLAGLRAGIKDLYDIKGHVTGCGNPVYAATHEAAKTTAPAVRALLESGATVVGKTHTDELAYSLMGVNAHYGTPRNTAAPDRVPGGSSSGSVAAVAAGTVEVGLGSDTGGSVRMPASFCGVYGIRTTHGLIPLDDVMALAPSFDTAGWFARDARTLGKVGEVYGIALSGKPTALHRPTDVWALVPQSVVDALAPQLARVEAVFGGITDTRLSADPMSDWFEVFRVCQASEIWQVHGSWVSSNEPKFGPGIAERFAMASEIDASVYNAARTSRAEMIKPLVDALGDGVVMVIPTAPGPAPLLSASDADLDSYRKAALSMLCPAGLAGLPQVSIPGAKLDGAPLGLSLLGGHGSDGLLLAMAAALEASK